MSPSPTASPARISGTLGIICGAGRLPLDVAAAAQAHGTPVFLFAIAGEADEAVAAFPHEWIKLGELGKLFRVMEQQNCRDLVIVGRVARPRFKDIQFDLGAIRVLPRVIGMLAGGDDHLLSRIVAYFSEHGITVHGAHDVAPDILAPAGTLTRAVPDDDALRDCETGMRLIEALAPYDVGQAVVVEHGRVLAIEAAEGTDAMLARVAKLRKDARDKAGVLVKRSKPGQDLRVDMAAVGVATVKALQEANLTGLAVEAGRTIMVDRAEMIRMADASDLFIHVFDANGS